MSDSQAKGARKQYKGKAKETRTHTSDGKPIRKFPKNVKANLEEGVGVSKIKASLRQTRRLLAKDNLSASVRQEAERKLAALEDELRGKEGKQKEKRNALRYHKVRFFERQKLVRRIKQLKKAMEGGSDDKTLKEEELIEARLLLNYVLHYPMSEKYVALFPRDSTTEGEAYEGAEDEDASTSKDRSDKVKARIRVLMSKGELSQEPEMDLEQRTTQDDEQQRGNPSSNKKRKMLPAEISKEARKKKTKEDVVKKSNLEDDDFFGAED